MGEEEKKQPEENKEEPTKKLVQEKKIDEAPEEKKKVPEDGSKQAKTQEQDESKEKFNKEAPPPPPPPPQEIILRVYMHCEGCARKVRRCLKGFDGVEKVETDCKASKVVVKGEKADPLKVLERIKRKSHRQVELLSPIPIPPVPEEEPKKAEPIEIANLEAKKEEVVTAVLMVHMHCEACAQEIRRQIQKMKGVESAMPDLKSSEVVVKGIFKPPDLINFIHKRTGKHAMIIKVEPENPVEENAKKDTNTEEKKEEEKDGDKDSKKGDEKNGGGGDDSGGGDKAAKPDGVEQNDDTNKQEMKKSEVSYNYPQNYHLYHQNLFIHQEHEQNVYPPQMFSDENPNSCSVM